MASRLKPARQTAAIAQLDLFSAKASAAAAPAVAGADLAQGFRDRPADGPAPVANVVAQLPLRQASIRPRPAVAVTADKDIRVIEVEDLPIYTDLDHEMVDRSLETLPADKVWFTYAAVHQCFGISRATIARRMKDGLIPGIRFSGANVLEDGAVRRFNRLQLRWLLLAIRNSRTQHVERSLRNFQGRAAAS